MYFAEVDNEDVYNEYMRSVWRADKELQRVKDAGFQTAKENLYAVRKTVLTVNIEIIQLFQLICLMVD